jgi:hypothetical protein
VGVAAGPLRSLMLPPNIRPQTSVIERMTIVKIAISVITSLTL